MAQSLQCILTDVEVSFWDIIEWLQAKIQRSGLDSLGDAARTVYLVNRYDAGMFRGGYGTLLVWNPELDIMWMIPALEAIGAIKTAQALRDWAALFPGGTIPLDKHERMKADLAVSEQLILEQVGERGPAATEEPTRIEMQLKAANEDIYSLAVKFAKEHKSELLLEDV
jgi:hypothetical protein